MAMSTGEHCWKKNSGTPWARTSNLWIPSLTRSPLSYLGRYVEWDRSNTLYNKIPNIWFRLPKYSVLQLTKQCLRKIVVLLNFCLYVYLEFNSHFRCKVLTFLILLFTIRIVYQRRGGHQYNRNIFLNKCCRTSNDWYRVLYNQNAASSPEWCRSVSRILNGTLDDSHIQSLSQSIRPYINSRLEIFVSWNLSIYNHNRPINSAAEVYIMIIHRIWDKLLSHRINKHANQNNCLPLCSPPDIFKELDKWLHCIISLPPPFSFDRFYVWRTWQRGIMQRNAFRNIRTRDVTLIYNSYANTLASFILWSVII